MTKKITKRENYEALLALLPEMLNAELIDEEMDARLADFLNKEIEQLDKRAGKAKEYASKKKAEADALYDMALTVLQNEERALTISEVVEIANAHESALGATSQKMAYRLNKLVEAGQAVKDSVSIKEEGKAARKVNTYQWIGSAEEPVADEE